VPRRSALSESALRACRAPFDGASLSAGPAFRIRYRQIDRFAAAKERVMIDLIKKSFFTGIGLAAMTKEKVEEMAREWAKAAQLSGEKGQEFVQEVLDRSEKARKDFEDTIARYVRDAVKQTKLATHEDILMLNNRIKHLEQKLAEMIE
jgi:polyhydroxyalkanoate synthesis regulator phasin